MLRRQEQLVPCSIEQNMKKLNKEIKYMKKMLLILLAMGLTWAVPSKKEFSEAFIDVADKTNDAIVSIVSEKEISASSHQFLFRPNFGYKMPEKPHKKGLGSGVIFNAHDGIIVTNYHVVEDADNIKVILMNKHEFEAEVIGKDPLSDLAILRINNSPSSEVVLGDSDKLRIGAWVVAIGSPFGLELNHTVTAGIVSGIGRSDVISRRNYEDFIQHDAAINPGNSGGALFNLDGELVGINTAIATDGFSKMNAGVGFAIPINQVKRVVDDLLTNGVVSRGWLGVSIQDIDENMARALKLNTRDGAIISQIMSDSPAGKFGLKDQDIILKVNDVEVKDASHLKNLVGQARPNEKVVLTILRDNKEQKINLELGTRPDEDDLISGVRGSTFDHVGLKVENARSDSFWNFNEGTEGVVVTGVKPDSNAYNAGIREGDLIIKVDTNKIKNLKEYREAIQAYSTGDPILLLVKRDNNSKFVAFEID